ncbi:MAG TPA: response regulator transcription factor [Chloroflexia bacterium]|nr:response regulator transcription factor [Chloroflexia bacterium]
MTAQGEKILLADDEHDILMLVAFHLQRAGYQVVMAENGREALEKAQQEKPALAILDRMMPELDGVEVCRQLREINPTMYIIMLTALSEEEERIGGLEAGADDYIPKPFNPRELTLKVQAMLRHAKLRPEAHGAAEEASPKTLSSSKQEPGVRIDVNSRQVWKENEEVELTKLEFDLLKFLYEHPNTVFSRDRLLEQVWNYDYFGDERVVDVHMARLRKKLEEDPSHPRYIQTIRGVGYKYTP